MSAFHSWSGQSLLELFIIKFLYIFHFFLTLLILLIHLVQSCIYWSPLIVHTISNGFLPKIILISMNQNVLQVVWLWYKIDLSIYLQLSQKLLIEFTSWNSSIIFVDLKLPCIWDNQNAALWLVLTNHRHGAYSLCCFRTLSTCTLTQFSCWYNL